MKIKQVTVLPVLFILLSFALAYSAALNEVYVDEMVFCKEIVERTPVGANTVFPEDTEQVFCYTKIMGASYPVKIYHVWSLNGEDVSEVSLDVKSASWRTWSSKKILKGQKGLWSVKVVLENDELLMEKTFEVK
jgi:hypothetical protein